MHLKRNEFDTFLKRIITGDEKWIVYNNVNRKRWSRSKHDKAPQTTSKTDIHQNKIMLSVSWIGLVWHILQLPRNQTINLPKLFIFPLKFSPFNTYSAAQLIRFTIIYKVKVA